MIWNGKIRSFFSKFWEDRDPPYWSIQEVSYVWEASIGNNNAHYTYGDY